MRSHAETDGRPGTPARIAAAADGEPRVEGERRALAELERAQSLLREHEARLAEAQALAHLGSWETDLGTGHHTWSDELCRIFGRPPGFAPSPPDAFFELVHPEDRDDVRGTVERARGGEFRDAEFRILRPDGEIRHVYARHEVRRDARGAITHLWGTTADITDRKQMERALEEQREKAVQASREKSEFLANMSHELRTPLNGVIGMARLLRDTPLSSTQDEYVGALETSGEALLAVIGDVLDFSKIEAGALELERIGFDIHALAVDACRVVASQAHEKGVELAHCVAADVPARLTGDPSRLRQVLLNLLANAVKFTEEGMVWLRIDTDPQPDQLRFTVLDTGIGIDEANAAKLFEAFTQADQSTTRHYGGSGLGLTIASQLVRLMGGEISATRRHEGGSMFTFTAALPAITPPAGPELRDVRTLVISNNPVNREIRCDLLRGLGARYSGVESAAQARDILAEADAKGTPFELILLELNLPEAHGHELAAELAGGPALVVLSATASHRELAPEATFVKKPAGRTQILEAARVALGGGVMSTSAAAGAEPATSGGPRVLVVDDNEINCLLTRELLRTRGIQAQVAHGGKEAVAMAAGGGYAAIFMDCQMPVFDGYEATRTIRRAESGGHVPIIALTAHTFSGDRQRCLAAGMDDYLSKPIRDDQLDDVLRRWVTDTAAPGVPLRPIAAVDDGEVLAAATVDGLRTMLPPEMLGKAVAIFCDQLDGLVGELVDAVRSGEREEQKELAHKLRGSSSSFGASRVTSVTERIEDGSGDLEQLVAELQSAASATVRALQTELL